IEYGQVDSVFSFDVEMEPNRESKFHYWMCVSKSIKRAKKLNKFVLDRGAVDLIKTTRDYWRAWVKVRNFSFYGLEQEVIDLFNKSLIFMRTHVGKNGAIIASGDSDLLQYGRDTYAYIWPRDAAYSATALEKAGDFNASARFFDFCNKTITDDGYFMHKYLPDLSLGSSWHPWIRNGKGQLPIQEDGTAVVLYALWVHYELSKDLEFIEGLYNDFVKKAAEFLVSYRDEKTGLPKPSYDLWERIYGVSTYTACTVYGAINAAAKFAKLLGKTKSEKKYRSAAKSMKEAILVHLYDEKDGTFYKQISEDNGRVEIDRTVDMSSVYGIYKFGVLPFGDQKLEKAVKKTIERLEVKTSIGGIARFEGDSYHRKRSDIAGNPWIITAMWLAQYYVGLAKNESDMEPVKKWLSWVVKAASPSGILPEQINPDTGEHLSASPLTWSHAEYVITVISYLEKLEELEVCKACNPAD
ncbi:MAG: glycoside hydrolase family 15 protein, partial [Patescibacteria group bacterium]